MYSNLYILHVISKIYLHDEWCLLDPVLCHIFVNTTDFDFGVSMGYFKLIMCYHRLPDNQSLIIKLEKTSNRLFSKLLCVKLFSTLK